LILAGGAVAQYAIMPFLGWLVAAALGLPPALAAGVEVGMQNSSLAAGLARQYLTPEAALPGAIFPVWHNVAGAVLAAYWRRRGTPALRDGEPVFAAVTE
jgi:BASS family bile acid:Na+ symporter